MRNKAPKRESNNVLTFCNLQEFITQELGIVTHKIKVQFYNNPNEEIINDNFEKYKLIFGSNREVIPPSFGGPIQLCSTQDSLDCKYFVETIVIEETHEKK
jgi:hypothetical protein